MRTPVAAAALCVVAAVPASAQGVTGTPLGMATPGGIVVSFDIGASWQDMPRFSVGQERRSAGAGIIRDLVDDQGHQRGFKPAGSLAWGLPQGLFGVPAEVYVRGHHEEAGRSDARVERLTTGNNFIIPLVAPSAGPSNPGIGALLTAGGPLNVSTSRDREASEVAGGVRWTWQFGALQLTPGLEFAYSRLRQTDVASFTRTSIFFADYSNSTKLETDYYQFGASLGSSLPVAPGVHLFGVGRASYDLTRTSLSGSSKTVFGLFPGQTLNDAAVSGSDSGSAWRFGVRGGIAFEIAANALLSLAGSVEHVGSVAHVVYPVYDLAAVGARPLNGVTSATIARDSQLTYGAELGLTFKF